MVPIIVDYTGVEKTHSPGITTPPKPDTVMVPIIVDYTGVENPLTRNRHTHKT